MSSFYNFKNVITSFGIDKVKLAIKKGIYENGRYDSKIEIKFYDLKGCMQPLTYVSVNPMADGSEIDKKVKFFTDFNIDFKGIRGIGKTSTRILQSQILFESNTYNIIEKKDYNTKGGVYIYILEIARDNFIDFTQHTSK